MSEIQWSKENFKAYVIMMNTYTLHCLDLAVRDQLKRK
uniref:Uncharacterized protein n=1 Tax=Rhizophora mucronata TaxID=61149 RepID=A0A2P2QMG3_RHIMU